VLLSACAANTARIEKGALVGYGTVADGPSFDSLGMDVERHGEKGIPVFCVQLSEDAGPSRSDALTREYVERYLPPFQWPRYWPDIWREKARAYEQFEGNGYFITFREGRLASIYLGVRESDPVNPVTRPTTPARVGPADCGHLYSLPITREQFVEIFGPPDRADTVNEVYYH